jgi:hypothetical protein
VWANSKESMLNYDQAVNDEDAEVNKRHHGLYRQMALLINGGPSGHGNRLKLPQCIVTGVRGLFSNPGAYYVGHRELEWQQNVACNSTKIFSRKITFLTDTLVKYINSMSHWALAPFHFRNQIWTFKNRVWIPKKRRKVFVQVIIYCAQKGKLKNLV